jgi:signal peptidase II
LRRRARGAKVVTMSESESKAEAEPASAAASEGKAIEAAAATVAAKSSRAKWQLFAIVGVLSLIADQATKIWARSSLPVIGHGTGEQLSGGGHQCLVPDDIVSRVCAGKGVTVIDGFWDWRLSMNPGSAFGLFSGLAIGRILLTLVGIAAVIGMIFMLRKARSDQKILHWALALVAGGAVGNLVDRVYYGYVTDFVLWHYKSHEWPVFNVADIVLVVGVGLMFIDIQKENKRDKKKKKTRKQLQELAKQRGLVKDLQE